MGSLQGRFNGSDTHITMNNFWLSDKRRNKFWIDMKITKGGKGEKKKGKEKKGDFMLYLFYCYHIY